jgi:bifunctional non-homologous end joining protein LigD
MKPLDQYRKKRNLKGSTEPVEDLPQVGYLRFVIHKHKATRLHYDVRLELDGVYKSWAVPKGPSLSPADTRLAIFVEDHPLSYGEFEGVIPKGHYGAGPVMIWDRGTYREMSSPDKKSSEKALRLGLEKGNLKITFFGEKIKGSYALVRGKNPKQWMLIKKHDSHSTYKTVDLDDRSVKSGVDMKTLEAKAAPLPKKTTKKTSGFHPLPRNKVFKENRSADTCVFENGPVVTSLTKILWPEDKITKGDLLDYYKQISTLIVKHVHDRPMSLNRYPHGIDRKSFYQKNITEFHPKWFKTVEVSSSHRASEISYPMCQNEQSLLYLVNLNCIELHPWLANIQDLDHPDQMVVDIDPSPEVPFGHVIDVALAVDELFQKIKIQSFPKTSGGKGLHIFVPIVPEYSYDTVREFLLVFFQKISEIFPNWITTDKNPNRRKGKIYLDYLQNTRGQTMASAYCVRPKPGAPVSCPLAWSEVSHSLNPQKFHLRNMLARLEKVGDYWHGMTGKRFRLKEALRKLEK